ncbi:serine/threonine protein kinase [Bdellovibrio sp. HCB2-146]|uniref:serine/threonine protein kinase n=1 Tax=Bdellovibrio sp. HCB2-146 TaxID=3394362 RepID=UPI0039BC9519
MKRVGPYELLKPLATGGMAEVFLARSTSSFNDGKVVALKRTLPDFLDSQELCQMFLDEIRVGASLNHQNIVQVCDFGQTENQAFLVMEYIHGIPLRELIATLRDRSENLPLPFVLYVIKKVAEALEYAYNAQDPTTGEPMHLIHRDISPQNIMVTYEGEVKVIDFGIAKAAAISGNTQHGTIKGKLAYMSPEQASREPIDHRSDLFSLGIIFWELLANRRFFAGRTTTEVKHLVREYRFHTLNFSESENLLLMEPILSKLLHHDKTKRYMRAKDLCQDLQLTLNKNFPHFSSLEFAVYIKNLFFEKYERSMREMKQLLVGEDLKTERIAAGSEKTEKTVLTHNSIRLFNVIQPKATPTSVAATAAKPQPIPVMPPQLQPLPAQPPPKRPIVQVRGVTVVRDVEPEHQVSWPIYVLLFLGFGLFSFFGYQWQSKNPVRAASLLSLPEVRNSFASDYVDVTLSSSSGYSQVLVNGQMQNTPTPLTLKLLKNRPYQIELNSPGYKSRRFSFIPARDAQYVITMDRLPPPVSKRQVASTVVPQIAKATPSKVTKKSNKAPRQVPAKKHK